MQLLFQICPFKHLARNEEQSIHHARIIEHGKLYARVKMWWSIENDESEDKFYFQYIIDWSNVCHNYNGGPFDRRKAYATRISLI